MGQKDIVEKAFEDYDDVFADIINVFIYNGKQIIQPEQLTQAKLKSQYKADSSVLHELERDNFKIWNGDNQTTVIFGLENQTGIDSDMPLRIIGYDGTSFRNQLLNRNHKPYHQIVTLVLYFGNQPWNRFRSLQECLAPANELSSFVNDYKINVISIAYLSDRQLHLFRSDFGIIAEYFVKRRKCEEYNGSKKKIRHVDELLKFMAIFAEDRRFLELNVTDEEKKGDVNMCVILDKIEAKGRNEGINIGKQQEFNAMSELIQKLLISGNMETLSHILQDRDYYEEMLKEYGII